MEVKSSEQWAAEFAAARPMYEEFCRRVEALIHDLLASAQIDVVQLESRTKSVDGFREKFERKKLAQGADPFEEIHDLVGVRVITYYLEDVPRVVELLEEHFEVDHENSVNKLDALPSDQFGYLSLHYVVQLNDDRGSLTEWQAYSGLKAEIQVRTVLQHAWAAVSHKLDYKAAKDAPGSVRRKLYRLSALFELADEQFSEIRDQMQEVDTEYRTSVGQGDLGIPLDATSLSAYLSLSKKAEAAFAVMRDLGFTDNDIDDDRRSRDKSDLLAALNDYGMKSLVDLDAFLGKKKDIERLGKALFEVKEAFINVSPEDWINQLIVVAKDESDEPGAAYYNEKAVDGFRRARAALQ
jgi:ppGpp synthetase/RelA/SpoT-type nucleotidyltranferase